MLDVATQATFCDFSTFHNHSNKPDITAAVNIGTVRTVGLSFAVLGHVLHL